MKHWLTLLVAASACAPAPKPGATTISGSAVLLAPITGAHVRVSMLTDQGVEVVGESATDDHGNFEIELFAARGTLLVELLGDKGGATQEPVSGKALELSYTDRFLGLTTAVKLGTSVQSVIVSPWSTLVASRALWDIEANGTPADKALDSAGELFRDHFAGLEFLSSLPLDPSQAPTNGLSSPAVHGFVTTGLAVVGNDQAKKMLLSEGNLINTISITQWLSDDLRADGVFDGKGKNGPIIIVEDKALDLEFSRALLGASLGTFLTSPKNQSGIALADMTALINSITSDTSILYGLKPSIAVSEGDGPTITLTSPAASSTLRDQVIITGKAESNAGVAGVEVFLDKNKLSGGDRASVGEVTWGLTAPLTDGFHIIEVHAHDSTGKDSSLTVTFQSDATAPIIKFGYCLAYDDKHRSGVPHYNGVADDTVWWNNPSPPDPACNERALSQAQSPYEFHTFAELAKSFETSSRLAFVPEETGPVTTPQTDLVFEATIWKAGKQLGLVARIKPKPNESAREVALSSSLFGPEFLNVSPRDKLELRIRAADAQGNDTSATFFFSIDLLPSPLRIIDSTPPTTSEERAEHYSFGAGNAAQLFDPGLLLPIGIVVAKRYSITNPSDRAIALHFSLSPSTQPTASYAEWQGFIVGQRLGAGTDRVTKVGPTQDTLPAASVPVHFDSCYNEDASEYLARANLATNPSIYAIEDGSSVCMKANDLPSADPVATATSAWAYRVHTVAGELRFAQSGDYLIQPGETLQVSIGFPKPAFAPRTISACIPNFDLTNYVGHSGGRFSMFYEVSGYSPETFVAPAGLYMGLRRLGQNTSAGTSWDGFGWTDCAGIGARQRE